MSLASSTLELAGVAVVVGGGAPCTARASGGATRSAFSRLDIISLPTSSPSLVLDRVHAWLSL